MSKSLAGKINFNWETKRERILKFMRIPAQKKLEWLEEMRQFTLKFSTKQRKNIFWKLREINQAGGIKC